MDTKMPFCPHSGCLQRLFIWVCKAENKKRKCIQLYCNMLKYRFSDLTELQFTLYGDRPKNLSRMHNQP